MNRTYNKLSGGSKALIKKDDEPAVVQTKQIPVPEIHEKPKIVEPAMPAIPYIGTKLKNLAPVKRNSSNNKDPAYRLRMLAKQASKVSVSGGSKYKQPPQFQIPEARFKKKNIPSGKEKQILSLVNRIIRGTESP